MFSRRPSLAPITLLEERDGYFERVREDRRTRQTTVPASSKNKTRMASITNTCGRLDWTSLVPSEERVASLSTAARLLISSPIIITMLLSRTSVALFFELTYPDTPMLLPP